MLQPTLQDIIKYIGIAAVLFFLIKAFIGNKLDNTQLIILIILIMIIIIFIACQSFTCKKGYERFRELNNLNNSNNSNNFAENQKENNIGCPVVGKTVGKKVDQNSASIFPTNIQPNNNNNELRFPKETDLHGYTYLPQEFSFYERPPVCVTDKVCPVCPLIDPSTFGLLEFDTL